MGYWSTLMVSTVESHTCVKTFLDSEDDKAMSSFMAFAQLYSLRAQIFKQIYISTLFEYM